MAAARAAARRSRAPRAAAARLPPPSLPPINLPSLTFPLPPRSKFGNGRFQTSEVRWVCNCGLGGARGADMCDRWRLPHMALRLHCSPSHPSSAAGEGQDPGPPQGLSASRHRGGSAAPRHGAERPPGPAAPRPACPAAWTHPCCWPTVTQRRGNTQKIQGLSCGGLKQSAG